MTRILYWVRALLCPPQPKSDAHIQNLVRLTGNLTVVEPGGGTK